MLKKDGKYVLSIPERTIYCNNSDYNPMKTRLQRDYDRNYCVNNHEI